MPRDGSSPPIDTAPEAVLAPRADPLGLAYSLSPVDLPKPPAPLQHPLRWTTEAIATATLFLVLFNAHALRSWSYQLTPSDSSARIVTMAETWYDIAGRAGLNRPVEAMHARWQSARDARFGRGAPPAAKTGESD